MGGIQPVPRSIRDRTRPLRPDHPPAAELWFALRLLGGAMYVLRKMTRQERVYRLCPGLCRDHGRVRGRYGVRHPGESIVRLAGAQEPSADYVLWKLAGRDG